MSTPEATRLQEVLSERFDALAAFLCEHLGYGPRADLTAEKRREIDQEVEDAIDEWSEYENGAAETPDRPSPLQRLLIAYREAEEHVLNHHDYRDGAT